MNKLKQLILEQLNEIGEANLPIYPYENEIYTPTKVLFIFNTEEDEYNVIFKKYKDFEWSISFNIAGDTHIETNKNNMYRVMSTITDIVNYFINLKHPISLSFSGTKTKGYNDERRNNLYVSYISKSSNKNYDLKKIDNEYYLRLKIHKSLINYFNNLNNYDKNDFLYIYPELKNNLTEEINMIIDDDTMYEDYTSNSIDYIDTNNTLPGSLLEDTITVPNIPNTMSFYHGGNLDRYDPSLAQKKGRFEYGAGLYLTTHLQTARKYAKGSRKLYLITVEKGTDINQAYISLDRALAFISKYAVANQRKELISIVKSYSKDTTTIKAYIFNNIINNHNAIKPFNTPAVREFFIENNIDYDIVDNPFGWGEQMMILYNMNKIVKSIIIKPTDKIEDNMIVNK